MRFCKTQVSSGTTRGVFIASGMEVSVELAAGAGFDWVILDMEHGLGDEAKLLSMIRCLDGTNTAPLVRIPALREEAVKRALDFGAAGILCPMVRSADDARELVHLTQYPPLGRRGLTASSRASGYGKHFGDYFARANTEILRVVQIETPEALAAIDAIAAVDGVDVLFIGHSDLSLSLDCYGDFTHPKMVQAEKDVLAAAAHNGKIAGLLLKQTMDADDYRARGFQFLALGTDIGCLRSGYTKLLRDEHKG